MFETTADYIAIDIVRSIQTTKLAVISEYLVLHIGHGGSEIAYNLLIIIWLTIMNISMPYLIFSLCNVIPLWYIPT